MLTRRDIREDREQAITMVETMVVLLIVMILLAVSFYGIRSARTSGAWVAAVSAAQAYADAADAFAREHDGRYPATPGTRGPSNAVDWPTGAAIKRGPISSSLGTENRYLRRVPEPVQDGRVSLTADPDAPSRLTYAAVDAGRGYTLRVTVANGGRSCVIVGGTAQPSGPECSTR